MTRPVLVLVAATGVVAVALGVGLVARAQTAFGFVGASLFWVCGIVVLSAAGLARPVAVRAPEPARDVVLDGESARFYPRRTHRERVIGLSSLTLLGGWCAALGIVGGLTQNWLWPVLALVPAVYFLGFPLLAVAGRLRVGGTWITPTRVVDEHLGVRSELPAGNATTVTPRSRSIHIAPATGQVRRRFLAPRPWRVQQRSNDLVIAADPGTDPVAFAALIRSALAR